MFRRRQKVVVEVTHTELRMIRDSLLALRNRLIAEGRYTDAVDDLLVLLMR